MLDAGTKAFFFPTVDMGPRRASKGGSPKGGAVFQPMRVPSRTFFVIQTPNDLFCQVRKSNVLMMPWKKILQMFSPTFKACVFGKQTQCSRISQECMRMKCPSTVHLQQQRCPHLAPLPKAGRQALKAPLFHNQPRGACPKKCKHCTSTCKGRQL